MLVLRKGSEGNVVCSWQEFLRGIDLYFGHADGDFGPKTEAATINFQRQNKLTADGIVGNSTWGQAMLLGFEVIEDPEDWPSKPSTRPASLATRVELFGRFDFKPAPSQHNPEGISILGNWQQGNIQRLTIPQLVGVPGAHPKGYVFWHRRGAAQLNAVFRAWEKAGLSHLVKSWAGSWVPRFVRGSRTTLSNHAWGVAFDINVPWNGLRQRPALKGSRGSVRELVPIAHRLGFYWGNWFTRKDGMHFEINRLLTEEEIQVVFDDLDKPGYDIYSMG